jgi:hypothetical protein
MSNTIPDLRKNHQQSANLPDGNGKVYLKGLKVQCWYEHDVLGRPFDNSSVGSRGPRGNGRETWTFPDQQQAKACFQRNVNGD